MIGASNQIQFDVCIIGGGFMRAATAMGLVEGDTNVLLVDSVNRIHRA